MAQCLLPMAAAGAPRPGILAPAKERVMRDRGRDAQRKHGMVLRRYVTQTLNRRQRAQATDVSLVQDPAVYAAASEGIYETANETLGAARAAFRFLASTDDAGARRRTDAEAVADLVEAANRDEHRATLAHVLTQRYTLEPAPSVPTRSVAAPVLRWATTRDEAVLLFIDATRRLVVKAYALASILSELQRGNYAPIVDLANDMVLSYYLVALVRDYARVVTPHFAFIVDWFAGPALDEGAGGGYVLAREASGGRARVVDVRWQPGTLVQYVIVERADTTLADLLGTAALTLPLLRAVLFQVLFSLEAAWQLTGYLHYDAHSGNIMVRFLGNELATPFFGRTWAYKRAGVADYAYLTPAEHGNVFVEIIDAGRSRMLVPVDEDAAAADPRGAPRRLVGYPMLEEYGIFVDGARADRSWDVRRLAFDLLTEVDVAALVQRSTAGAQEARRATAEAQRLAAVFKDFVVAALGGAAALLAAVDRAARTRKAPRAGRRPKTREEQSFSEAFWSAIPARMRQLKRAPTNADVYDALIDVLRAARAHAHFRSDSFFDNLIEPILFSGVGGGRAAAAVGTSASTCLDHAFFDALRDRTAVPESLRATALLVGFVRDADVLRDPRYGSGDARDGREEEEEQAMELGCAFCGSPARGLAVPARVPFCGADCMHAAAQADNV